MCGRYTLIANAEAIRRLFELPAFDERLVVPRYNIAPTQPIVVVRPSYGREHRELVPMRWGLIPAWAKDPKDMPLLINARAESIADKPAFRYAFRRRRCLVPASGFYEWQKRGKNSKQPFAIRPDGEALLAFAGIWETWFGPDGSEIDTAAIVTVDCNESVRELHNRMPAIIAPADFQAWLSSELEVEQAAALLQPAPEDLLTCVPVSPRVNSADNDDADLWRAVPDPPEPPRQALESQLPLF